MDGPEGLTSVSTILTNMALGYVPDQTKFIARRVFPNLSVNLTTGKYNILNRGQFLRPTAKKLDNREPTPIKSYDWTTGTYTVDHWGVAANWSQLDLANAEGRAMPSAKFIASKVLLVTIDPLLSMEVQVANLIRTSGNWTTVWTGVNATPGASQFLRWNDDASTPIKDVQAVVQILTLLTGVAPNMMILPLQVYNVLINNPSIMDRIRYDAGQSADKPVQINERTLAKLFMIDDILIPSSVVNSAREGQPDSIGYVWGKDVWIGHVTEAPSVDEPSAGYFFSWNGTNGVSNSEGVAQGNSEGLFIRRYRTERPALNWVESEWFTTPKVTAADLGALLVTAIA